MKVILKQTVPNVGKEGQVVRVKDGFALNFLFPRGMAIVADKSQLKVLEARNQRLAADLEASKAAAESVAEQMNGKSLRMEVRAGTGQRLFGAVTSQDIADAIKEQLGVDVDKKLVGILQPIKQLGHFSIEIDVHRHIDCKVTLDVVDPEAEEEARVAAKVISDMAEGAEEVPAEEESTEETPAEEAPSEE